MLSKESNVLKLYSGFNILLFLLSNSNNIYTLHPTGKYIFFDHCNVTDLSDKYYINRYLLLLFAQYEVFKKETVPLRPNTFFFCTLYFAFYFGLGFHH